MDSLTKTKKIASYFNSLQIENVMVCLELNVTARGDDLAVVAKNLRTAPELYQEDMKKHPETVTSPISTEEFIEFLKYTEP